LGVVIAAPFLATLRLAVRYIYRKMFDLDPWPDPEPERGGLGTQPSLLARIRLGWQYLRSRIMDLAAKRESSKSKKTVQPEGDQHE
jgi:hypothetical protein